MQKTNTFNSNQKKNYAIEFYRFLFACIIFIFHFRSYGSFDRYGQFSGGYLAVEFFFITSGYFMMKKISSSRFNNTNYIDTAEKNTVKYFLSRYLQLMPPYWFSIIILIIAKALLYPVFSFPSTIMKGIPELLAVQIFWRPGNINGHLWFVSALLWGSAISYYLLLKNYNFYIYIGAPIGCLAYLCFIYHKVGYLDLTGSNVLIFSGLFRAFVEIGIGCVIYQVHNFLREIKFTINTIFLSIIELVLFTTIIAIMYFTRNTYNDFNMIFLMSVFILITFLEQSFLSKLFNHKILGPLGKASFVMYLNQRLFQDITKELFPNLPFWPITVFLIILLTVYSIIITKGLDYLKSHIKLSLFSYIKCN